MGIVVNVLWELPMRLSVPPSPELRGPVPHLLAIWERDEMESGRNDWPQQSTKEVM